MQGKCDINGSMIHRAMLLALLPTILGAAQEWVLVRGVDGTQVEGQAEMPSLTVERDGKPMKIKAADILSIHSAAPASEVESGRIVAGLAAIQEKDRPARDRAVEELTAIGVP